MKYYITRSLKSYYLRRTARLGWGPFTSHPKEGEFHSLKVVRYHYKLNKYYRKTENNFHITVDIK